MNRKIFAIILVVYVTFGTVLKINAQTEPPWPDPEPTGVTQPIYIFDATIDGIPIDIDEDWIGIFDNDLLVGKGQVDGLPAQNNLIAYLEYDPPAGSTLPGAIAGNSILFKIWDKSSNQVLDATITDVISGVAVFGESSIVTVSINATSQVEPGFVDVIITTNPPGLKVLIDGTYFTAPVTQTWETYQYHTLSTDQSQSGGTGTQYSFTQWSEQSGRTIIVEATPTKTTFTAYFATSYYLTTDVSPANSGTISPTSGWYSEGTNVQLSAQPAAGTNYSFSSWSGDLTGDENPTTLSINAPKSITANFAELPLVEVMVAASGPPDMWIYVDGQSYDSPQYFMWQAGSKHTIGVDQYYPHGNGTRRSFVRWSDNGAREHEITVPTHNEQFTAGFVLECILYTYNDPEAGGYITRSPDQGWYEEGAGVELTAHPDLANNYSFLEWTGDAHGSSSSTIVYMNGPKYATAKYTQFSGSDIYVRFPTDLKGAPGDTVTIPVNILSDVTGMGIISYQFTLNFGSNILNPIGVDVTGTMTESWQPPVFNDQTAGQIQVGGYTTSELTGTGTLVNLLFIVTGAQGSQTNLDFSEFLFNSGTPETNTESGVFRVEREQPDILGRVFYHQSQYPVQYVTMNLNNGYLQDLTKVDGSYSFIDLVLGNDYTVVPSMPRFAHLTTDCIHASDASLAAHAAFGLVSLTDFQKRAADVDEDGRILMYDASQILYYAVLKTPLNATSLVGEWIFQQDSLIYPNLTVNKVEQNYEAIVLGDVNADLPNPLSLQKHDENPINLPDLLVKNGEEIKIDLKFVDEASFLTLFFNLTYDPDMFELKSVQKSNQTRQFELFQNSQRGELTLGMLAPRPVTIHDEIVTLTFASKGKGEFEFKFTDFMVNTNEPVQYAQHVLIGNDAVSSVKSFRLYQNYPNPFNPGTTINYTLPWEQPEETIINIYDIRGTLVQNLLAGTQGAGEYNVEWNGEDINGFDVPSGIYFCSIRSNDKIQLVKMIKAK